ncbi:MAG: acyl-CoA dehydrogenase family protein, partial [Thermoanaerobaculia bacterium]
MSEVAGPDTSAVDFGLTEEQRLLQQEVRRFAEERIRPGTAERDQNHEFPVEVVREMGE